MTRLTAKQFRETTRPAKRQKYGNRKTTIDNIEFPSKAEASYYCDLKVRERAGEVSNVKMQTPYALTINGRLICTYRDDFSFQDHVENRFRVVDVKGFATPVFKLKLKMMKAIHNIDVEVLK